MCRERLKLSVPPIDCMKRWAALPRQVEKLELSKKEQEEALRGETERSRTMLSAVEERYAVGIRIFLVSLKSG